MALQIMNAGPDPEETMADMKRRIEAALPEAEVEVSPGGAGHFEIRVVSPAFDGLNRVKQQQLVYGAITELMSGKNPPVHAIDRLECRVP